MEKNWTVVRSRPLVKDRWIDLRADDCVTPSGHAIAPYYVLAYPDWVNVVAMTADLRIVMVRQYRHAVQQWVTELPGGAADAEDGDLAKAAMRELEEETGYGSREAVTLVSSLFSNPSNSTNRVHTFLVRDAVLRQQPKLEAGEEGLSVELVSVAEVIRRLQAGEIGQAMHVAGIYQALMAAQHLAA